MTGFTVPIEVVQVEFFVIFLVLPFSIILGKLFLELLLHLLLLYKVLKSATVGESKGLKQHLKLIFDIINGVFASLT